TPPAAALAPPPAQPPQHDFLRLLIGDAEAAGDADALAVLAQHLGAERVDRPAMHPLARGPELTMQTPRDLFRGFVGESDGADAAGICAIALDQRAHPLDEAERFPRTRTGEHEHRADRRLDRAPLRLRPGRHPF